MAVVRVSDHLCLNVTEDRVARTLLAVFAHFMDRDLAPWFSLVLHYYVPDTKGNTRFHAKKKRAPVFYSMAFADRSAS